MKTSTQALLSLLGFTILADKRLFIEEVETFMIEAQRLDRVLGLDMGFTQQDLMQWFEESRGALQEALTHKSFAVILKRVLADIPDVPDRNEILISMIQIARSDAYVDVSETALVHLVARHWNMPIPGERDMRAA